MDRKVIKKVMDKLELYAGIRVIERGGRMTKGNSDNE